MATQKASENSTYTHHSRYVPLRSADGHVLFVPRTQTVTLGPRTFLSFGPSLPLLIRDVLKCNVIIIIIVMGYPAEIKIAKLGAGVCFRFRPCEAGHSIESITHASNSIAFLHFVTL